jgi:arylsulfatase A-like enzyme
MGPTINMDFCPYFAKVAGDADHGKTDGRDLMQIMRKQDPSTDERPLFWHYPLSRPHFLGGRSSGAVRKGRWKLIQFFDTGGLELYDLENDISESRNLASANPGRTRGRLRDLENFRQRTDAQIPASCKDYDPDKYFLDPLFRDFLQKVVY